MTEPWSAEAVGGGRYRFTNTFGGKLVMITLQPVGTTEVSVEGHILDDPHAVPAPVDAGDSFVATVRGPGVQITATDPSTMRHYHWSLDVS